MMDDGPATITGRRAAAISAAGDDMDGAQTSDENIMKSLPSHSQYSQL